MCESLMSLKGCLLNGMEPVMKRAAFYLRVIEEETTDNQLIELERVAEAKGGKSLLSMRTKA